MYSSLPHLRVAYGDSTPRVSFWVQRWRAGSAQNGLGQMPTPGTSRAIAQAHFGAVWRAATGPCKCQGQSSVKREASSLCPWKGGAGGSVASIC